MKTRLLNLILLSDCVLLLLRSNSWLSMPRVDSRREPGRSRQVFTATGAPTAPREATCAVSSSILAIPIGSISARWMAQIYTSADGGKNWEFLYNFNRPKLFVDHIIVDPRDSKTLYVAAHRHKEAGGFFKSTDGGRKWRESPELKNEALHSLFQSSRIPTFDCRHFQRHVPF